MIKRALTFLSHPAWTGATCFITAFFALGLGGTLLGWFLGLFHRLPDLIMWLMEPATAPRFAFYGVAMLLVALAIVVIQRYLTSRSNLRLSRNSKSETPLEKRFLAVALSPGVGNARLQDRYILPPSGSVLLARTEFQLDVQSLIFDTSAHIREFLPLDTDGKRVELRIPKPINGITAAHFLLNSGNSKMIYARSIIGSISLIFRDAPPVEVELVLGYNIREWCPGNPGDYVREVSDSKNVRNAWVGMSKTGANAVIDCLTVPVFPVLRSSFLEKILFVHKSALKPPDTMGVNFSVFAISLEIGPSA